jgi:hypothetical protein
MGGPLIAAVAAVLFLAWLWWDRHGAAGDAEAQLRRVCMGDQLQVERLIDGERRRASGTLSRADAARRALERHRRDNR